ncbi:type II toxin-antitoxin system HicA family toxin [Streptomyces sp. SID11385]|uniref:type II toxin-antitoxin system HicA family toxin n=2 Tax=unclassified Streptomyces TaxID=2593676 RepID=UPI0013CC38E6|nr:type II toxin-antitoxin system HicA family toxin [Streptomyces sp. SID11385]NEA41972.1 type II toxin-antitoxin system HicA family toxin [Streptomyces sp. SID11385]
MASGKGVRFGLERQGKHEVWYFGTLPLVIPRHTEISEPTAKEIIRRAEGT